VVIFFLAKALTWLFYSKKEKTWRVCWM